MCVCFYSQTDTPAVVHTWFRWQWVVFCYLTMKHYRKLYPNQPLILILTFNKLFITWPQHVKLQPAVFRFTVLLNCWAEKFALGVNFRGSSEMTVTVWFKDREVRRKVLFWYKIWQWVSYHSMQRVFFPLSSDKHSVDEHLSELMQKVSDVTSVWLYTTHSFIHSFIQSDAGPTSSTLLNCNLN